MPGVWKRARLALAGVVAVAMAAAGCSGDDPEPDRDHDEGPLTEFLGFSTLERGAIGLPQLSEEEEQRQYALQELIARCMADHEFEYVPVAISDQLAAVYGDAYTLGPEQFAAQYGYGVSTLGAGGLEVDDLDDPNEQIRANLSPEAQQDYQLALWGDPDADEPGCHDRATAEVYGTGADSDQGFAEFADLFGELSELYQRIEDDPRMTAAHGRWADCMAQAGYPGLAVPQDAQQSVFERMSASFGEDTAEAAPAALAEVRDYELALAPVDYGCQREHVDGPRAEVVQELEEQFVAEHRAELEAYRDWLAEIRSG